jgi:hypothetical protein
MYANDFNPQYGTGTHKYKEVRGPLKSSGNPRTSGQKNDKIRRLRFWQFHISRFLDALPRTW